HRLGRLIGHRGRGSRRRWLRLGPRRGRRRRWGLRRRRGPLAHVTGLRESTPILYGESALAFPVLVHVTPASGLLSRAVPPAGSEAPPALSTPSRAAAGCVPPPADAC